MPTPKDLNMPKTKTPTTTKSTMKSKAKDSAQTQRMIIDKRLDLAQDIQNACYNGVLPDAFEDLADMVAAGALNPQKLLELGTSAVCQATGITLAPEKDSVASECRKMGLKVGDTIEGTEGKKTPGSWWNTTRLTLLWLGVNEAVFLETYKSLDQSDWSEPQESSNWTLRARKWKKVAI
jgi:hypothetical protein